MVRQKKTIFAPERFQKQFWSNFIELIPTPRVGPAPSFEKIEPFWWQKLLSRQKIENEDDIFSPTTTYFLSATTPTMSRRGSRLHTIRDCHTYKYFHADYKMAYSILLGQTDPIGNNIKMSVHFSAVFNCYVEQPKSNFPFLLLCFTFLTWDRCYGFKNIFAEKFGEKLAFFDSKQC
jgi:hypothetical protein